jgi:hypothetical protein
MGIFFNSSAGLPDGICTFKPKIPILECNGMEKDGILNGHLVYIMTIWYIIRPFGNLEAVWHIFPRFGILCHEISGNPAPTARACLRRFVNEKLPRHAAYLKMYQCMSSQIDRSQPHLGRNEKG